MLVAIVLILAACSHRGRPRVVTAPTTTRPPMEAVEEGWREKGVASWYGEPYHGRRTASGEIYDMFAMTAAHKTLPFGSVVEVRRRDTGDEVTVRINDRGPFIAGRIIDLSFAAAKRIGLDVDGVAPVSIEVVGRQAAPPSRPTSTPPAATGDCVWVQVAAFSDLDNARRAEADLADDGERAVVLEVGDGLWRVRLGPFTDRAEAERSRNRVTDAWPGSHLVDCGG